MSPARAPKNRAAPRVVLATRLFAPEVSAGAFRLRALTRSLLARSATVRVLTTTPPKTAPQFVAEEPGLEVSRFPVLRDSGGNVRGYVQYLSFDIPLVFRLIGARYDLAIAEAPPTTGIIVAAISALRRRPYAYYAADIWTDGVAAIGAPRFVISIIRGLEGLTMRHAATVLSISDEVTERIIRFGVAPERIATVGNGIDTDVFTPDGPVADDDAPYFVYTGTMSEWQGAEVFIRALPLVRERFPDVRLRFFGQGSAEAHLRELASTTAPEAITFGGVVAPERSAEWIRGAVGALVSIAPGLGYDFARPTKTYAAAACGTPVVFAGSDGSSGGALVREHGLGIHSSFTPESVAAAMIELLTEHGTDRAATKRRDRAVWIDGNASLRAVGDSAADAVLRPLG
ncbi:glycosyltransferase family 4 protein [Agromyces lapidis]|uniref:D-inositol 3-phosphate glycosyltransferase n=1 Tax=Agromyces lapidis TaxID=279574 RepID=A0ABV5SRA8_9MICO|nr:glycosyltransferase family 4 protein [Agromyces lapidis]